MDFAREFGLAPQVIEKDYTLGWLLAGIAAHPEIGQSWVFKGGTCLKKCYFETYRFSEDLDFTVTNPEHLTEAFLLETFRHVADWLYDQAGIEVPAETERVSSRRAGGFGGVRRGGSTGPTYVVECAYCGKQFKRKTSGTALKAHKDINGYPCPGRHGYLVDTIY